MRYLTTLGCLLGTVWLSGLCVALTPTVSDVPLATAVSTSPAAESSVAPPSVYPKAAEFELEDQHNTLHSYRFPRSKVSVLVFADYAGSEQIEAWIRPVYERYQDRIDIHGVAALPGVPEIFRGLLRAFFQERLQYPVMLDWQSQVAHNYRYQHKQANVLIVDPAGQIRLTLIGAVNPGRLHSVFEQIDQLLTGLTD